MTLKTFCEQALAAGYPKCLYSDEGDDFTPQDFLTRPEYAQKLKREVKVEADRLITLNRQGEVLTGSELYFKRPAPPKEA
ncbi:MAG TPA: hypothetical protein VGD78_00230 [Chthoniobacterales bacterium]